MAGTKLFNPSDSLKIRDPQSNVIDDGMIVNPPRYAQYGGLQNASKTFKNSMKIAKPAATIRKMPVK